MTRLKKITAIILSCVMVITLSSCGEKPTVSSVVETTLKGLCEILRFINKDSEPEITNAELVLQYIQEKNTDAIYDMLCERVQETPDIKEQIEQTFDFIEGDVISYDISYPTSSTGKWSEDGKAKIALSTACNPIETTSGKVYQLVVCYYDENDYEPDLVGIYCISMVENNQENTGTDWFSKEIEVGKIYTE